MMKNNFASIKSHKKLYKAGKTWMAATLLTVGLAGGAMLSGTANVHADTTTTVQAQQAANPELANAQSDAQKQQSTINSANAQLKDQQGQLSAAQGQQSSAQQALDQAKQAQQAATANDPAVKKAQADVDQAQQQVNNQKTVVDEAQTAVDNGQQNVESAANAVSQASQKVDQARQAAKDAINKAADQRTSEAQKTINSLENQGKSQASQNLDNQINNVKDQVSAAQKDVNNTNSQISNLQNQVKTLENQGKTSTTFTGFQYPSDAGAPDSKTDLSAYNNKYHYVSNPADAQVQIDDYANLSPEIQKELTIYAAQLVNSFGKGAWEAAGIPNFQPLMINDASLNEAKEAAQLYAQDNWSIDQHGNHDIDALNQAALDNGAFAREMDGSRTPAVDESATGQILPADRSTTLDKLKNAI
ncbi:MAG: KxYKxGKxW signal peptide domain-containing protein, partial [Limosilactobacillus sp.]